MRTLLLTILILIIVAVAVVAFIPSTIHIEKTMVLKARPVAPFNYINTAAQWTKWAVWIKQDPTVQISYNGPETGSGAALNWNSQVPDFKTGNMTIESSQANSQVKASVKFDNYGVSENSFTLQDNGNGTKITWSMDLNISNGFPGTFINKIKSFSWKNKIDGWMDTSLMNLDAATSNAPDIEQPSLGDTLKYRMDTLAQKFDSLKNAATKKDTIKADSIR